MTDSESAPGAPALEPLMTYRGAAEILGVSERHVWGLAAQGALASVRIGRTVRFAPSDLRDFIARSKTGAPPAKHRNSR